MADRREHSGRALPSFLPSWLILAEVIALLASGLTPMRAAAGSATKGRWIGPFSMEKVSGQTSTGARATHMSLLCRRTPQGDSTLIVHWHDKDKVRAWEYWSGSDGAFLDATTTGPRARLLSNSGHNIFCSGHVNLHDGRLLIVGGTAPGTASEVGTGEATSFNPSQPDLWTSANNWVHEDTSATDRWYPTATHLADGTVILNSGVEYFEMPVFGGFSPQDSSGAFRSVKALSLGRFASWLDEKLLGQPPALRDHTSTFTANIQMRWDGRGGILTFGGKDVAGQVQNQLWLTWDHRNDAVSSWESRLLHNGLPLASCPEPRSEHAATIMEARYNYPNYNVDLYVYGGRRQDGVALGDVWVFHSSNGSDPTNITGAWTRLTPGGTVSPGPRYGHTMVFDPGPPAGALQPISIPKLLVFGGKRNETTWCATDTVFVLDLTTSPRWEAISFTGGTFPAPRYRHAAVMDPIQRPTNDVNQRMAVQGGLATNGQLLSDLWMLSRPDGQYFYTGWTWSQITNAPGAPAVYKHSMVLDQQWDRLTVFGGDTVAEGTVGSQVTGEADSTGATNAAWAYNFDFYSASGSSNPWRELPVKNSIIRRSGHSAIYYANKSSTARVPERFNPLAPSGQRWTPLPTAPKLDRGTYPFIFQLPNQKLLYAGKDQDSKTLTLSATPAWGDSLPARPSGLQGNLDVSIGGGGSAVQYRPDKILKIGFDDQGGRSDRVEESGASYKWFGTATRPMTRGNPNSTMLPTGDILLTGGRSGDRPYGNDQPGAFVPQIWSSSTGAWSTVLGSLPTTLSNEPAVRGYHSTAILLPDARVLSAGGELGSPNDDFNLGTIFEPPYLFDPTGDGNSYAVRPLISIAPSVIGPGCPFPVTLGAITTIGSVCLIRPGAVTHAFNQDQRYVPLTFTQDGLQLTVDGPTTSYVAPPGDYLLFVLDNSTQRVPSIAKWVRVAESVGPYQSDDSVVPSKVTTLTGLTGLYCTRLPQIRWNAPCDDDGNSSSGRVRELDLRWGTSTICNTCTSDFATMMPVDCEPAAAFPGQAQVMDVPGLYPGSYHFRLVSRDDNQPAANTSQLSNGVTVVVLDCEEGFYAGGDPGGGYSLRQAGSYSSAGASMGSENTLFSGVAGSTATDIMKLDAPRVSAGRVHVRLRQGARGQTRIDQVALLAVDHASAREVVRIDNVFRLASREQALGARGTGGFDALEYLQGEPAKALVGDTGDTLTIELPPPSAAQDDDVLWVDAQAGRTDGVDSPGLLVFTRDPSGQWAQIAHLSPRGRWSLLAVRGVAGDEVRLVFKGNHAIKGVGRMTLEASPQQQTTSLLSAEHNRIGAVDPALFAPGTAGLMLAPRDTVELEFSLPASMQGEERTWFLSVTGASTGGAAASRIGPSGTGGQDPAPARVRLEPPRPNPFRGEVTLRFGLPKEVYVRLEVFDLAGRRVANIVDGPRSAGWHTIVWDGRAERGGRVAPGIYLSRLRAGSVVEEQKLVVMP